ncbi:MAG: carnitine 3-dehydrogenase [Kiloniellales bacterium]|nr:carnitine 3-dehydrogenase [Kiloniellales bacterium]
MTPLRKAACIGGGVIGAGWVARLLLNGIDVTVGDPDPQAERKVGEVLANAERALDRLTPAPKPPAGRLGFATSIGDAVAEAELIVESVPERPEVKRAVYIEIEAAAPPEAIIASSTSGILPSELQAGLQHPDRLLVAHPFNPVYLLPLVELVAGRQTAPETVERARTIYRDLGMHPLVIRKEIEAFVADRLLEAVWRECLWLVKDGIATTEEIDDAIRFGFGLRWAQMGIFETYRVAGGEAGMKHFIAQFGPCLKWPWTKLTDVPELTEALVETIAAQSDAQSGRHSIRELERTRDDNLVAILQALKGQDWGAGKTLADYERRLHEAAGRSAAEVDTTRPLRLYEATVRSDWTDYNGHMNESRYLEVFSEATDAAMRFVGCDQAYVAAGGSYFTAETHICHLGEARLQEPLYVESQTLSADGKKWRLFHRLYSARSEELLATGEHMLLHVDLETRRVASAREPVAGRLAALAAAQAGLPQPEQAGAAIGKRG